MIIVGIDPGQTGATVLMDPVGRIVKVDVMKSITWFADLMDETKKVYGDVFVYIEKAQAMPKNGVASMFRYGQHYGELIGVLVALQIPYEPVPPATWPKAIHTGKQHLTSPKDRSLESVRRLFPAQRLTDPDRGRCVVPHKGIIDAILIAEYGRQCRFGRNLRKDTHV